MLYILLGLGLMVMILLLLIAAIVAPYSELMGSFSRRSFRNLMIALVIATILALSYGTYYLLTYQPTF
ncbi:hypothetical protein [Aquibacillus saliphilus]|uniref:hypothetical protein n=1 Tax=Aquibacillus saliphilus TaxID=1909422 RepID=UPI001CF03F57|nr:hypothetical protein [Aquibacillus saliphilus]